jgi:hypothetical protein
VMALLNEYMENTCQEDFPFVYGFCTDVMLPENRMLN